MRVSTVLVEPRKHKNFHHTLKYNSNHVLFCEVVANDLILGGNKTNASIPFSRSGDILGALDLTIRYLPLMDVKGCFQLWKSPLPSFFYNPWASDIIF